jgi:hypothetical protein
MASYIIRFKKVRGENRLEEGSMTKDSLKEIQMTKIFSSLLSVQDACARSNND